MPRRRSRAARDPHPSGASGCVYNVCESCMSMLAFCVVCTSHWSSHTTGHAHGCRSNSHKTHKTRTGSGCSVCQYLGQGSAQGCHPIQHTPHGTQTIHADNTPYAPVVAVVYDGAQGRVQPRGAALREAHVIIPINLCRCRVCVAMSLLCGQGRGCRLPVCRRTVAAAKSAETTTYSAE